MVRQMRREARAGRQLPFVVEYDGRFVGQLTVSNIVRGSAQFASVGYWIDEAYAGRGIITRAVAMAIDHCFGPVGLHRIEVAIRPENTSSLRVVEKLGIKEIGYAPRYLHIDGDWRDHKLFAITREEVPLGLLQRLESSARITPVTRVICRHTARGNGRRLRPRSYRRRRGPVSSHLRGARRRVGRLPDPQGTQAPRRDGERPAGRGPLRAGAHPLPQGQDGGDVETADGDTAEPPSADEQRPVPVPSRRGRAAAPRPDPRRPPVAPRATVAACSAAARPGPRGRVDPDLVRLPAVWAPGVPGAPGRRLAGRRPALGPRAAAPPPRPLHASQPSRSTRAVAPVVRGGPPGRVRRNHRPPAPSSRTSVDLADEDPTAVASASRSRPPSPTTARSGTRCR